MDGWVRARSGLANVDLTAKLRDASDQIIRYVAGEPVELRILDSDAVAAYAWPNGRILVTRGLIDIATRDELAAAIAHELGHLIEDGYLAQPAAIVGAKTADDREVIADQRACQLLDACGIPRSSMLTLLEKVRTAESTPESCRARIDERLSLLRRIQPRSSRAGS